MGTYSSTHLGTFNHHLVKMKKDYLAQAVSTFLPWTVLHYDNHEKRGVLKNCVDFALLWFPKYVWIVTRGWCIKFATGLNIIIGIAQKVYEWSSCPFAKIIPPWKNHFGKITAWSHIYFLNYRISLYSCRGNYSFLKL